MSDIVKICIKHGELTKDQICIVRKKGFNKSKTKEYNWESKRCRQCERDRSAKYKKIHREEILEKHRVYNQTEEFKIKNHNGTIRRKFGIDYQEIFKKQNGLCANCNKPETLIDKRYNRVKRLSVDHCHKTGKVRELLCNRCNILIGWAQDSIDFLKGLIVYLERHNLV